MGCPSSFRIVVRAASQPQRSASCTTCQELSFRGVSTLSELSASEHISALLDRGLTHQQIADLAKQTAEQTSTAQSIAAFPGDQGPGGAPGWPQGGRGRPDVQAELARMADALLANDAQ